MNDSERVARSGGGKSPIRVLSVIDCLEVGGAQYQLLTLAAGIPRSQFAFTVATSGHEPLITSFRREGVPVRTLTSLSIKHRLSPVFTARLTRLAQSGDYDLIHAHLHSASVSAAVASRLGGLPLVLTHHSIGTWQPGWQRALATWADHQADVVIAVSTNIGATVSGAHVRVIPNGVRVPDEVWTESQVAAVRRELGVPTDSYLVGYVGRLSRDKNPVRFVEVAARAAFRCPTAHFLLVGDGPLWEAAMARAQALGLAGRVTFAGFVPNAGRLHQAVDVLVLTSDSEGSPLVVLDAMANGRPVVATAVGDVPQQVFDQRTGFVLPPGDVEGLANAVVTLEDSGLRAKMGEAGRERARCEFSLERMFDETQAVYRAALKRRRW